MNKYKKTSASGKGMNVYLRMYVMYVSMFVRPRACMCKCVYTCACVCDGDEVGGFIHTNWWADCDRAACSCACESLTACNSSTS